MYLEKYLWPHFDAEKSSDEHVLSIIAVCRRHCDNRPLGCACPHLHVAISGAAQRSVLFSRSAEQVHYRAVSFSAGSTVPWRCPQMVVEKFREGGLSVWKIFHSRPEVFTAFIVRVMTLRCARACTPIVTAQAPAMQSHT